jgi:hypothetical protein
MATPTAPSVIEETRPAELFPSLSLEEWEDTKRTLHRFTQIVGKIRLASMPPMNHWWHVTLYVTTRGLTTGPMPYDDQTFAIDFDFIAHRLVITTSAGAVEGFPLDGLSVAKFYESLFSTLSPLGIEVDILAKPFDLIPAEPFLTDEIHASYDREYVSRWWRILIQVDQAFKEFAGRFAGKTSPVHLYWHSFDLVVTRFVGRRAPELPGADPVTREAYSHEVISFGWWPGDDTVRAPAFYSYTAPEPQGLTQQQLRPDAASWQEARGSHRAMLMYDDLRLMDAPGDALLEFLQSAYEAGATTAGWDRTVVEMEDNR